MSDETREFICKALVIGATAFTAYEVVQFCVSQENLNRACAQTYNAYTNISDDLVITLDHLLAEQIA